MDFKSIASAALGSKTDIPLSTESQNTLQELISKGVFNDKKQFVEFAMKAFAEYKLKGSSSSALTDIIKSSPLAQGSSESDIKSKLVPMMTEVFNTINKK